MFHSICVRTGWVGWVGWVCRVSSRFFFCPTSERGWTGRAASRSVQVRDRDGSSPETGLVRVDRAQFLRSYRTFLGGFRS